MFQRVATTDTKLIIGGLIILVTMVTVGVGIVEYQLATLTQRPPIEGLFYITCNKEQQYWAYVYGYRIALGNIYPKADIAQIKQKVVATIESYTGKLPQKNWFAIWHKQFLDEAMIAKKTAGDYWRQTQPYVEAVFLRLKIMTQQAIEKMEEHIREYR